MEILTIAKGSDLREADMSAIENHADAGLRVHTLTRNSLVGAVIANLVAAALAAALFAATAEAKSLEPRALKALFPGTFEAVVYGFRVSFTAHRDGSLIGRYAAATDTGRWSIQRGQLCIMMSTWLSGETTCSAVVQQGQWYRAESVVFRKP